MGRIFVVEPEGRSYRCKFCKIQLALVDDLVSRRGDCKRLNLHFDDLGLGITLHKEKNLKQLRKWLFTTRGKADNMNLGNTFTYLREKAFHSRRGKAYLFNNAVNISVGASEERMMLSGLHMVADVFCCSCGQIVGWKYESAQDKSQKYKEGKFVLERGRIVDEVDFSTEFYISNRSSLSDAEDA